MMMESRSDQPEQNDAAQAAADAHITGKLLVIIPTYNELENLPRIVGRLRTAVPEADLLIADDNSPDGTGARADELAADDPQIHVRHRAGKEGLGAAYLDGFAWGLERGYDVLVEMDADGSHPPEQLPDLLARIEGGSDVVIGSRWVPGGSVVNWPRSREVLSRSGSLYARIALGLHLRDVTAGYRAFRATALQKLDLSEVISQGYCFQIDLAQRAVRKGLRVDEVPITFVEREYGTSKMNRAIVVEALWLLTGWGVKYRASQVAGLVRRGRGRGERPAD
jgi:dolichol-phosphate mannosyltransferase